MKRIYSLFLVMLLCLVGTTALAQVASINGYTIKSIATSNSTPSAGKWYVVKYNNSSNYLCDSNTGLTVGSKPSTGVTASSVCGYLWQVTGTSSATVTSGYGNQLSLSNGSATTAASGNSNLTITNSTANRRIYYTSGTKNYYLRYSNGVTCSNSTNSATWYWYEVTLEAPAGSFTVSTTTTDGGVIYNGKTYGNGETIPTGATLADCSVAAVAGYAGKLVQSGTTLAASYIPVGRVFIKSNATPMYSQSTNQDADDDMYLTSLSNVMGLSWNATNYWSIWDITFDEATETVTIVNEGNRDIMTPLQRYSATSTRDAGYLYYNIDEDNYTGYGVGDCSDASKRNIVWNVNEDGSFNLRAEASATTNFMYFDTEWNSDGNEKNKSNTGDHVAKSGTPSSNNKNKWSIIPVTAEDEAAMFARNVQELNGYVGGVVTLTNVEQVEQLNSINTHDKSSCEEILAGDQDGALKMKAILDIIKDANEFGQELVSERPFFLENMSSYRPQVYSRLYYNSSNSRFQTTKNVNVDMDNADGVFYVDKSGVGGAYVAWNLVDGARRYINKSNTSGSTTALSSALSFEIDPIIPGIWRIKDTQYSGSDGKVYLTITQSGGSFWVVHYEVTEPSTLWKFKTYTTFDYTLKADPEGGVSYCTGYTTYGQYMDSKLPATTGVKAWMANGIEWRDNEMHVIMREANHSTDELNTDCYWMKAGYGYLITKEGSSSTDAGTVNDNQLARFIPDADYKAGNVKFAEEDGVANYFKPIPNDGKVTEEDWEKWFYFSYVPTGQTYTHYKGEDVKGVGVGFYRLQPGKTYKRGKARLAYSDIFDDPTKEVTEWTSTATKGQMIFVDADGETTDVVTIGADGSLYHEVDTYFDLSGRRVQNPSNGVFIKNGKKVWVK